MKSHHYANLADFRERFFKADVARVARAAGLDRARLLEVERTDDPTVYELDALASVYGVDADVLSDTPIRVGHGDGIHVLALLDEFAGLGVTTKVRITQAASAARAVVELRNVLLGAASDPRQRFQQRVKPIHLRGAGQPPFEQGRRIAAQVRRQLNLGSGPIPSMRDLVAESFPEVTVLYADLANDRLSGLSFADATRGPTIVLNLGGKNLNPCVRRFSLAHELCHLLFDWNRQQPLAQLSGFYEEQALEVEQRANSFALRLLCPEQHIRRVARAADVGKMAIHLMADYGLHYRACELAFEKIAHVQLETSMSEGAAASVQSKWIEHEEPQGLSGFPLEEVAPERRTVVARLAAEAWSRGLIQRDRFAEYLGVPPGRDVESVVDFFALDLPAS